MSLILMRHAKSLLNEQPTIPEAHNVLSPTGVGQALEAGRSLIGAGITRIISSPVPRAWQTAMIVSGVLGGLPITTADALSELRSRNPHQVDEWLPEAENLKFENDVDCIPAWGLESQRDVWNRATGFLSAALDELSTARPVLIVSHTFVMRALMAYLGDGHPEAMLKHRPNNAQPIRLSLDAFNQRRSGASNP